MAKLSYFVTCEGCYLVSPRRAAQGLGLNGGAWSPDLRRAKRFPSLREARKVSDTILNAHVYRRKAKDLLRPQDAKVGDTVQNKFVGTCKVEKVKPTNGYTRTFGDLRSETVLAGTFAWMEVSYEAVHRASGEIRRFLREDPIGLHDDGTPFFWK